MLVEKKFIYIALPRCASTAFYYSCLVQNINVEHLQEDWTKSNSAHDFSKVPIDDIMNYIEHGHERVTEYRKKYGEKYPVISVKRDNHDRFYSLFKHVIFDLKRVGAEDLYHHFRNLTLDELFFFTKDDVSTKAKRWDIINEYLLSKKFIKKPVSISLTSPGNFSNSELVKKETQGYLINIIDILLTPQSYWHNHDPDIIWFDIKNLREMEIWISNRIGREFKMMSANSSKDIECSIKMDGNFVQKYDDIYGQYDSPKFEKTLI